MKYDSLLEAVLHEEDGIDIVDNAIDSGAVDYKRFDDDEDAEYDISDDEVVYDSGEQDLESNDDSSDDGFVDAYEVSEDDHDEYYDDEEEFVVDEEDDTDIAEYVSSDDIEDALASTESPEDEDFFEFSAARTNADILHEAAKKIEIYKDYDSEIALEFAELDHYIENFNLFSETAKLQILVESGENKDKSKMEKIKIAVTNFIKMVIDKFKQLLRTVKEKLDKIAEKIEYGHDMLNAKLLAAILSKRNSEAYKLFANTKFEYVHVKDQNRDKAIYCTKKPEEMDMNAVFNNNNYTKESLAAAVCCNGATPDNIKQFVEDTYFAKQKPKTVFAINFVTNDINIHSFNKQVAALKETRKKWYSTEYGYAEALETAYNKKIKEYEQSMQDRENYVIGLNFMKNMCSVQVSLFKEKVAAVVSCFTKEQIMLNDIFVKGNAISKKVNELNSHH